ncbi:M48 family metallopeptidase [Massilia sp. LC238]|uniref:M48 family metallopeptidase n=1 Tax=Massilia sp. LC238 TaxID=1502852 RepID=UPI0004E420DD|nr:M48 family metallopeptidase [Massilia sp. LC238]KFC63770.1 TPR repeat-containing putative Zn-dependent protease [Massilia sp. LC238]
MPANKPLRWQAAITLAAALAILSGCETVPTRGTDSFVAGPAKSPALHPTGELPPPAARAWPGTEQDVLNERAKGFGLVNAPEAQAYLNRLYARIKDKAGVPAWPGEVHLLADQSLNAYATGAGNIYLSLPWFTSVESEDELVALLSHEFAHIYLHYHLLDTAVQDADTVMSLSGAAYALARKTAEVKGWNKLDSLVTAYVLGRGAATVQYGRSQESAAAMLGLNLSLKLGYSYEHGMKAFLERLASWEDDNVALQKQRQEALVAEVRKQARDETMRDSAKRGGNALIAQGAGELNASINGFFKQVGIGVENLSARLASRHPETTERISTLAQAVAPVPPLLAPSRPVSAPLEAVRQDRRTAALLANYALAFEAIAAPAAPASIAAAQKAASGNTATHAVPLYALYLVFEAQPAAMGKKRFDPALLLDKNLESAPDRAWKVYVVRSERLKDGQRANARKILDAGLQYFQNAEEAWPDAVRFYGETQGWDEAKRMAGNCGQRFRRVSQRCTNAAASPAERAAQEKHTEQKASSMVDKLFKKK